MRQTAGPSVSTTVSRPRLRGKKGLLIPITNMPVDIALEIFSHLTPVDLLNLAWSCRSFNEFIMSSQNQARTLWINAFNELYSSKIPLPPCPADLNLAQYTRFLLMKRCMKCNQAVGHYESWQMRLRVCLRCLEKHCLKWYDVDAKFESREDFEPYLCRMENKIAKWCLKSDVEALLGLNDEEKELRRQMCVQRKIGEEEFFKWREMKQHARGLELTQIQNERRAAIMGKLEEIGWSAAVIDKFAYPSGIDKFVKSKKLTEREWNTKLCSEILEYLEDCKQDMYQVPFDLTMTQITAAMLDLRAEDMPWPKPSAYDLVAYGPFAQAITDRENFWEWYRNPQTSPSYLTEDVVEKTIKKAAHVWIHTCRQILSRLLPVHLAGPQIGGYHPLELATVFFQDGTKLEPLTYEETLSNRLEVSPENVLPHDPPIMEYLYEERPWLADSRRFRFHMLAHQISLDLLRAYGEDPMTITAKKMTKFTSHCFCSCTGTKPLVWPEPVKHAVNFHAWEYMETRGIKSMHLTTLPYLPGTSIVGDILLIQNIAE